MALLKITNGIIFWIRCSPANHIRYSRPVGCIRLHRSENHDQSTSAHIRSDRSSPQLVRVVFRCQVDVRAPIRHLVRGDCLQLWRPARLISGTYVHHIAPLSYVIGSFGVRHHQYADNTQMYITASKDDLKVNIDRLEKCTCTSVVIAQRPAAESQQVRGDSVHNW